jgi:hypothetical protein
LTLSEIIFKLKKFIDSWLLTVKANMKNNTPFPCKRNLLFLVIGISLVLIADPVRAQIFKMKPKYEHALGFAGGFSSGMGLSYRQYLNENLLAQGTFAILKTTDNFFYNIGGEVQLNLNFEKFTRFYVWTASAYFFNDDNNGKNKIKGPFRLGTGIGVEIFYYDRLGINLEGGFMYFSDGQILILPQAGFYYYF